MQGSESSMQREVIRTTDAPAAIGPYSQAIAVRGGRTIYTSGQIPLDPKTMQIVGEGDIIAQTERVLDNLQGVLTAAGVGFAHVVRAGIFLADLGHFNQVNELYARRFAADPPARSTVQVAYLPRGVLVEIDMIAVGP
jgi:2-iminobutanoate/2-iminopropanoate deaminase